MINGEQLPSVLHMPPPHSSFNSQGQFIGSLEDILEGNGHLISEESGLPFQWLF